MGIFLAMLGLIAAQASFGYICFLFGREVGLQDRERKSFASKFYGDINADH